MVHMYVYVFHFTSLYDASQLVLVGLVEVNVSVQVNLKVEARVEGTTKVENSACVSDSESE